MSKEDQAQLLKGFKDIIIANKEYIIGLIAENMDVSDILDNVAEDRDKQEVVKEIIKWLKTVGVMSALEEAGKELQPLDDEDEHKLNVRCE